MAIINFTFDKDRVPENAVNLKEVPANVHGYTMWTWETHVGLCIRDREANGYNDSDFYMTVWNHELNQPEEICFASTRGWTYPAYGSYIDATPEVMNLYNEWINFQEKKAREKAIEQEKRTVRKYKEVQVIRGRKVPIGTVGRVFWIGDTGWGESVGIETASGERHFTSVKNVEVIIEEN